MTYAVKPVSGEPPSAPAVHDTVSDALPGVTPTNVGAAGAVSAGVGVPDTAVDAGDAPALFIATTVIEYAVPLTRLVTVQLKVAVVHVKTPPSPSSAVTVYPETVAPPDSAGPDHATSSDPSSGVTVSNVGAPATVAGVSVTVPEAEELPVTLAAVTDTEYSVPFTRLVIVHVVVAVVHERVYPTPSTAVAV